MRYYSLNPIVGGTGKTLPFNTFESGRKRDHNENSTGEYMKTAISIMIVFLFTIGGVVACSEQEQPTTGQSEQQQAQPGETAQQQQPEITSESQE
jgi:hypothetical protein